VIVLIVPFAGVGLAEYLLSVQLESCFAFYGVFSSPSKMGMAYATAELPIIDSTVTPVPTIITPYQR
jgi:hypothetical protein